MGLFGTSGIRGSAETLFTPQFCFDIGRTFAQFLDTHSQKGPIAAGMDPRYSSPEIKRNFVSGLIYAGREVFDEGICPVPAIHYVTKVTDHVGSAMISGSHIAGNLNGIKFFAFGDEILKEHEAEIEKIYEQVREQVRFENKSDQIREENRANELYTDMLVSLANLPYSKMTIVIDPGNGSQSFVMPEVFERLGLDTIIIDADAQQEFTPRDTETDIGFDKLKTTVSGSGADLGIAWDADGDRVVFVDGSGTFIPGDYTGALIAKDAPGEFIVTPINTSQVVEHIGKKIVRTKVGSPFVVAKMKEVGAEFGFEANGGGISRDIMLSRDGGSTAIKLLNLIAKSEKTLGKLIDELPKFFIARSKVEYTWEMKDTIINEARKKFKGIKVEELDGLKIWLTQTTWILFRSSSNAPEFRVFVESEDEEYSRKLLDEGILFVKEVIKNS